MEKIPVQKIARVLNVLVLVALVCNIVALPQPHVRRRPRGGGDRKSVV